MLTVSFTLSAANTRTDTDQVLVKIGRHNSVTSVELEKTIKSSPFYTQFNTMTTDKQALIRGDMLKRLVAAKLLGEEAKAENLHQSAVFKQEITDYRTALLYREYIKKLRSEIKIPADVLRQIRRDNKKSADAYSAAKIIYKSTAYKKLRQQDLQRLEAQANISVYEQRINPQTPADTILLEGKNVVIRYGDIVKDDTKKINRQAVIDRLHQREELVLFSSAAIQAGIDVSEEVVAYINDRLPALMITKKEKQWIPDDSILQQYYSRHPNAGVIPQHWHVGQIVLASKQQAEKMLQRIHQGESLFTLAGKYSIDQYGKSKNGDMGWITDGKALPALNAVLKNLPVGKVSDIIKIAKGYHIVEIIDSTPGSRLRYDSMKGKLKQLIVGEKMIGYLKTLQKKYRVKWQLVQTETTLAPKNNATGNISTGNIRKGDASGK